MRKSLKLIAPENLLVYSISMIKAYKFQIKGKTDSLTLGIYQFVEYLNDQSLQVLNKNFPVCSEMLLPETNLCISSLS